MQAATINSFDIKVVQTIVAESTKNVLTGMVLAVMNELQLQGTFASLADKVFEPELSKKVGEMSKKAAQVYGKLLAAVNEEVGKDPMILGMACTQISLVKGPAASEQFVASFVFRESLHTVARLEKEQPESLKQPEIWS